MATDKKTHFNSLIAVIYKEEKRNLNIVGKIWK